MVSDTPTDGRCNYEYDDGGYCEGHPMDNGRCFHHGGRHQNGGAPEGNNNAAEHYAYAEHAASTLTEGEQQAFEDVAGALVDSSDAQDIARHAASYCLMMGHRTGDDRWFRRFEGICDKFGLAPDEVQKHEHEHGGSVTVEHGIDEETERRLGAMFDAMGDTDE